MTTIIDGSAGITFPNGSNPQAAPCKVLQVVNSTNSSGTSTTSTSFVDTNLSATITPLFSTSKILVFVNITGAYRTGGTNSYADFNLVRNGTQLFVFESVLGYNGGTSPNSGATGTSYLDSPATTSAVTYKVQFAITPSASGTIYINNSDALGTSKSTMTLMEIAQ